MRRMSFGGGSVIMQESDLRFAQCAAARVAGLPGGGPGPAPGQGCRTFKEHDLPFFLHVGIRGASDVREARKTCIYVARFTNTGLDFYYGLPLGELNRFTGDAVEVMKEIRRAGKG